MRLFALATLLAGLAAPAAALDRPALRAALDSGDTRAMTRAVEAIYAEAGVSWDDAVTWTFKPYDYTFNYFDWMEDVIVLGAMPMPDEVDAYWQNWSRTLTGGRWQGSAFFASEAEAAELARFNQFVLALHEAGHAVTYRYDYEHLARHNYAVNCREYYADRLTMGALDDLAETDPAFEGLRTRYVALMASMNATIAEADRHHIESFAALDADCAVIEVAQPTPETLQPYASAFFERQRLLAGADLPPLKELVATYLEARRAEFMEAMPYAKLPQDYALETIDTLPDITPASAYSANEDAAAMAFDLEGKLHMAQLGYEKADRHLTLSYGPRGALQKVVDRAPYPVDVDDLRLIDVVPLAHDWLLALIAEEHGAQQEFALYEIKPRDGDWQFALMDRLDGMALARLLQAPDGTLLLLASADGQRYGFNPGWVSVDFKLDGQLGAGRSYEGIYGVPLAVEADGDLVTEAFDLLMVFDDKANFNVIAGNHLPGRRDGTRPEATEVRDTSFAQALGDGRLLLVDRGPRGAGSVVRELQYGE